MMKQSHWLMLGLVISSFSGSFAFSETVKVEDSVPKAAYLYDALSAIAPGGLWSGPSDSDISCDMKKLEEPNENGDYFTINCSTKKGGSFSGQKAADLWVALSLVTPYTESGRMSVKSVSCNQISDSFINNKSVKYTNCTVEK